MSFDNDNEKNAIENNGTSKKGAKKLKAPVFKNVLDTVKHVAKIAEDRKASYIKIINVGPRLVITDYFVIIEAANTRLTRRISQDIEAALKKSGIRPINIDGVAEGDWVLMDYDDFVIHIFTEEFRSYYDLERLWRDSKVIKLKSAEKKEESGPEEPDSISEDSGFDLVGNDGNEIKLDFEIKDREKT